MRKTLIFGHQKPDTDSVCASICLSYLKNKLGYNTEARILGELNAETKFVLDYFNVDIPKILHDVKVQVKDMPYNEQAKINEYCSIEESLNLMLTQEVTGLPIIDKKDKLVGYVNLKAISKFLVNGNLKELKSSIDNIANTLNGKIINRCDDEIKGQIKVIYDNRDYFGLQETFNDDDILIICDSGFYIKHFPNFKAKLIILINDAFVTNDLLKFAKDKAINLIVTKMDLYTVNNKIRNSNYVEVINNYKQPITTHLFDYRNDFIELTKDYGYTNYPVVNNKEECVGLIKVIDVHKFEKQPVILVDHNQVSQSVDGLEEANVVEIVDHHHLSTIDTAMPINFRLMPVGSTCTIVYQMYLENNLPINKKIAGLLLAAILSDTLLLKSPVTTKQDIEACHNLALITEIDYQKFGLEMLKSGSSIEGKTPEVILNQDFKKLNYEDITLGISQVFTLDTKEIEKVKEQYIKLLNDLCLKEKYRLMMLLVTDTVKGGSYIYYNESAKNIIADSYNLENLEEGTYLDGFVSRKKQFIPPLLECLERRK